MTKISPFGAAVLLPIAPRLAEGEISAQGGDLAVDGGGLAVGLAAMPVAELADVGASDRLECKLGLSRDVPGEPAGEADSEGSYRG